MSDEKGPRDDIREAPLTSLNALDKCRDALREAKLGGVVVCFDEEGRVMSYTNLETRMCLTVLISALSECDAGSIGVDSQAGVVRDEGEKLGEIKN